jgi:hypothetical protein
MARKCKSKAETETSFMYPSLHHDVVSAVSDTIPSPSFHEEDSNENCRQKFTTHVRGKFKCNNSACTTYFWTSGTVSILIRSYAGNRYNAVIFNQRCRECFGLGTLMLNKNSYVDRVANSLKIWAGVPIERPHYALKSTPPHESNLCEGCKRGLCRQAKSSGF